MPTLHLLNQEGEPFPQPTQSASGDWETGCWYLTKARSKELVGHPVHLHRRKAEPAFLSGIIKCYRRVPYENPKNGTVKERTVFIFSECFEKSVTMPPASWPRTGIKIVP